MRWNYRLKAPKIVHPCVGQGKCENSKKKFLRSRYTQYLLINTQSGSVNDVYKNFHNFVAIEQNPPSPFVHLALKTTQKWHIFSALQDSKTKSIC